MKKTFIVEQRTIVEQNCSSSGMSLRKKKNKGGKSDKTNDRLY